MEPSSPPSKKMKSKEKLQRCIQWLEEQNGCAGDSVPSPPEPNDDDDESLVEANKSELMSVPPGIDGEVDAVAVPVSRLRIDNLRLECGWRDCGVVMSDYEEFQLHVSQKHLSAIPLIEKNENAHFLCLWDSCGHSTSNYEEFLRHINYHSYHARLLAIGLNARPTLKLMRCKKDSRKRNKLPELLAKHTCLWIGCNATFNSMPEFVEHTRMHSIHEEEPRCRWAGCASRCTRRSWLRVHIRMHTGERAVACYHCGQHYANYLKLTEHIQRQNASVSGLQCRVCGAVAGSGGLLRAHEQAHVALHACAYCDMSLPTVSALATHVRHRHTGERPYQCTHCTYRSKTKCDLKRHLEMHKRREKQERKKLKQSNSGSDSDASSVGVVRRRVGRGEAVAKRTYCCHMCSDTRTYSRGSKLTVHLVKKHGIQLPFGHPRFRYQISDDGMYRLTTTRYESLEVSKQIMERRAITQPIDGNTLDVKITEIIEATKDHPKQIVLALNKKQDYESDETKPEKKTNFEITMCDVDEFGKVIKQKFYDSDDIVVSETDYTEINKF